MRTAFLSLAALAAMVVGAGTADAQYRGRGYGRVYNGAYSYGYRPYYNTYSYGYRPYYGRYSTPYYAPVRPGVSFGFTIGNGGYYPGGYGYYPGYRYRW